MIYPYNVVSFCNKKKWHSDTCSSMDDTWKHYATWEQSVTKDHILHDPISQMFRLSKSRDRKKANGCCELRRIWEGGLENND